MISSPTVIKVSLYPVGVDSIRPLKLKRKKKRMKNGRIWGIFALLTLCILLGVGCENDTIYSRTKTPDRYYLHLKPLNDTMTETYSLNAGDAIAVTMEVESGRLDVVIAQKGGEVVYRGNEVQSGDFVLNITETGKYTISVTGDNGRGKLTFEMQRGETK